MALLKLSDLRTFWEDPYYIRVIYGTGIIRDMGPS